MKKTICVALLLLGCELLPSQTANLKEEEAPSSRAFKVVFTTHKSNGSASKLCGMTMCFYNTQVYYSSTDASQLRPRNIKELLHVDQIADADLKTEIEKKISDERQKLLTQATEYYQRQRKLLEKMIEIEKSNQYPSYTDENLNCLDNRYKQILQRIDELLALNLVTVTFQVVSTL